MTHCACCECVQRALIAHVASACNDIHCACCECVQRALIVHVVSACKDTHCECCECVQRPTLHHGDSHNSHLVHQQQQSPCSPATLVTPQLQELKGSPLTGYAQQLRAFGAACVAEAMAVVCAAEASGMLPQGAITEQDVTWGVSIVMTRAIRMQSREDLTEVCRRNPLLQKCFSLDKYIHTYARSSSFQNQIDRFLRPGQTWSTMALTASATLTGTGMPSWCAPTAPMPLEKRCLSPTAPSRAGSCCSRMGFARKATPTRRCGWC